MNTLWHFIEMMGEENNGLKEEAFSVFDHILNQGEAQRAVMSYPQALGKDKIEIFEAYQKRYMSSFKAFYNLYKNDILIYTIYEESNFPQNNHFKEIKSYGDSVDTLYKCTDLDDFLGIIAENLKEHLPFRDIVFINRGICIRFNFDFSFLITFDEKQDSFVGVMQNIFTDNGLFKISGNDA
jgi:hypothetical protein